MAQQAPEEIPTKIVLPEPDLNDPNNIFAQVRSKIN